MRLKNYYKNFIIRIKKLILKGSNSIHKFMKNILLNISIPSLLNDDNNIYKLDSVKFHKFAKNFLNNFLTKPPLIVTI